MQTQAILRIAFMVHFGGLLVAQMGTAAPPPNDNFTDRIPLTGTRLTVAGSNIGATVEPAEPVEGSFNSPAVTRTVWWTWVAPSDGALAVSVLGDNFSGIVNIHTGSSVSSLTPASASPWGPDGHPPNRTTALVESNTAHHIAAGSLEGEGGEFAMELAFVARAANDNFADRIALGSGSARVAASTFGATGEAGEQQQPDPRSSYGSLWWSWTATESGPVVFQVAGITPSPTNQQLGFPFRYLSLNVFVGDRLEGLKEVTRWVESGYAGRPWAQSRVDAVAGTTYHVSAGGEPGCLGDIELTISSDLPPIAILTGPGNGAEFKEGTVVEASAEANAPGGRINALEFFALGPYGEEKRLGGSGPAFRAGFTNLPPGRYILNATATDVFGVKAESIPIEFDVRAVNDAFAERIPIAGAFMTVSGNLHNATLETSEPEGISYGSIWWTWTAPVSGTFTFTAHQSRTEIRLDVFTGDSLGTLERVTKFPGSALDRTVFYAQARTAYAIAISGYIYEGRATMQVAAGTPPSVSLTSPTNSMRVVAGNPLELSVSASDPDGSIDRVEYFDDRGRSMGAASNAPFALSASLPIGYYHIYAAATDSQGISTRSTEARVVVIPVPPPNDDFANRIRFTGSSVTVTGNAANATFEPGQEIYGATTWWEWTAPGPGDFTITAEAAERRYVGMAVYSGTKLESLTRISSEYLVHPELPPLALSVVHAEAGERFQIALAGAHTTRITVTQALPPVVRMLSPTNGAEFLVGDTLTVCLDAFDPDGSISRVELYRDDDILVATLTNEPFMVSLPLEYPAYTRLEAAAFDSLGFPALSSEVLIHVRNPGPLNDAFTNRLRFTGFFTNVTGSLNDATLETEEHFWASSGLGSVWWEWTAPESGTFTINVVGEPGGWPSLAILSGTELGWLTLITNASPYATVSGGSAQVTFEAQAGEAYPIAVAGWGQATLSVARTMPPVVMILQPTQGASFRFGEPPVIEAHAEDADGAIERVEFYFNGALLGVATDAPFTFRTTFSGSAYGWLRARAIDNDGVSGYSPEVLFEMRGQPPANDNFAERELIQGWLATVKGFDWEATAEPGDPTPNPLKSSIWWKWTAPASGRVKLVSDAFNTYLAVCTGTNLAELKIVASGESVPLAFSYVPYLGLDFDAVAGTSYSIVFQPVGNPVGSLHMSLLLDAREMRGPRVLAPGLFAFDLRTTLERTWIIEATTNLLDWVPVAASHCANGTFEFRDPTAAIHPRRFYRAVTGK